MRTVLFIICTLLTAACAYVTVYFMKACRDKSYKSAAVFKTLAGLCFVIIGLLLAAAMSADKRFAWLVALGLVFGLLGDVLLAIRFMKPEQHNFYFIVGAVSFAVGHGLYILAMLTKYEPSLAVALTIGIIGLAAAGVYAKAKKTDAGHYTLLGGLYMALVVGMGAIAIGSATAAPGAATLLFAAGGILFPVSDSLLSAYSFGPDDRFGMNIAIHATYYLAQLCIAWSLAWI